MSTILDDTSVSTSREETPIAPDVVPRLLKFLGCFRHKKPLLFRCSALVHFNGQLHPHPTQHTLVQEHDKTRCSTYSITGGWVCSSEGKQLVVGYTWADYKSDSATYRRNDMMYKKSHVRSLSDPMIDSTTVMSFPFSAVLMAPHGQYLHHSTGVRGTISPTANTSPKVIRFRTLKGHQWVVVCTSFFTPQRAAFRRFGVVQAHTHGMYADYQ